MNSTVIPIAGHCGSAGRQASALLDAARTWRRPTGDTSAFPDAIVRRMGAVGLMTALDPLDGVMRVMTAQAGEPLDMGRPGEPAMGTDARLMAWILGEALAGSVSEDAVDRLALRVDIGARALLCAGLHRLAGATRPRVARGVWPAPAAGWCPEEDPARNPTPASVYAAAAE